MGKKKKSGAGRPVEYIEEKTKAWNLMFLPSLKEEAERIAKERGYKHTNRFVMAAVRYCIANPLPKKKENSDVKEGIQDLSIDERIKEETENIKSFFVVMEKGKGLGINEVKGPLADLEYIYNDFHTATKSLLRYAIKRIGDGLRKAESKNLNGIKEEVIPYFKSLERLETIIEENK